MVSQKLLLAALVVGVATALIIPPCAEIGCLDEFNPVCGSNGVTYKSPCALADAACVDRTITHKHEGECKKTKSCPSFCIEIYSPVCGTDGKTYSNTCFLGIATCNTEGKVTMKSRGQC